MHVTAPLHASSRSAHPVGQLVAVVGKPQHYRAGVDVDVHQLDRRGNLAALAKPQIKQAVFQELQVAQLGQHTPKDGDRQQDQPYLAF